MIKKRYTSNLLIIVLIIFSSCRNNIDETQFADPAVKHRPLQMLHDHLDTATVLRLKRLGFGGIVTNVSFKNYLQSPENWKNFREIISYTIDTLGLRVWLYDELGYPSGTAGGQVLKAHPELEAQGLAVMRKAAGIHTPHPVGHGEVVFACADGTDSLLFIRKPYYEGTHATANWVAKRRYTNVMEQTSTEEFIKLTHKQYWEQVGKYFGRGIEAFFTDEPSYLGTYFTGHTPPGNPPIEDAPNPDIPLLPTLNWGTHFPSEFEKRRGYDLLPYLPYLIQGESTKGEQIRIDYYLTLAELFAENYFGTIKEFCDSTGVASSGHLLLEENLFHHAVFTGDLMMMYKYMNFPGIDLLTAWPSIAKDWGATMAIMARSVADFYGKEHVMSEISDAFDSEKNSLLGRMASVGVQYAYGVDHFNSYYNTNNLSEAQNRQFTDYIARTGYLMAQGKRHPQTALFYPIETIWANTFPSMTLEGFNPKAVELSNQFKNLAINLVENQIEFDYIGSTQIMEVKLSGDRIVTPSGGRFSTLIIPANTILPQKVSEKIRQLSEAGVTVIYGAPDYSALKNASNMRLEGFYPDIVSSRLQTESSSVICLFVNTGNSTQTFTVDIKTKRSLVRIWDPLTGKVQPLTVKQENDHLKFTVSLAQWQTAIITVE